MLTLQELKRIVDIPEQGVKVPTPKSLRETGVVVAEQRLKVSAVITAYSNGYALYQACGHSTVISIHLCGDYLYYSNCGHTCVMGHCFENEAWYMRLVLEGEDRLNHNQEVREWERNISYSIVSEEWSVMQDTEELVLDNLIRKEMVDEILQLLTERQRMVIKQFFFMHKTQKQISNELGITSSAVSTILSQAIRRIRKRYPVFTM